MLIDKNQTTSFALLIVGALAGVLIVYTLFVFDSEVFVSRLDTVSSTPDPIAEALGSQSSSDEIEAIDDDIRETNKLLNELDAEFANIEAQLNF